jgi:hypothetical protein
LQTVREHRRKVLIRGKMRAGGPQTEICIRDLSSRGLMAQAHAAPARGAYVEIIVADQPIVGRVVWAKDRRFGIRTNDPLNVLALIHRIPAAPSRALPSSRPRRTVPAAARQGASSSRALGNIMQFALIAAFAVALGAALVNATYQVISSPFENVSVHLGGRD